MAGIVDQRAQSVDQRPVPDTGNHQLLGQREVLLVRFGNHVVGALAENDRLQPAAVSVHRGGRERIGFGPAAQQPVGGVVDQHPKGGGILRYQAQLVAPSVVVIDVHLGGPTASLWDRLTVLTRLNVWSKLPSSRYRVKVPLGRSIFQDPKALSRTSWTRELSAARSETDRMLVGYPASLAATLFNSVESLGAT